jgi:hypothetical protein
VVEHLPSMQDALAVRKMERGRKEAKITEPEWQLEK